MEDDVHLFPDTREHARLTAVGTEAQKGSDVDKLRDVAVHLDSVRIGSGRRYAPPTTDEIHALFKRKDDLPIKAFSLSEKSGED
ncbi:hypothetical protein QN379_06810 [Glaciimonas sp. Gout2]|uniref:hypothetical protein n=1 Tax=Glaciimonas sp. Gout2 TaxID=3048625 RepID=UPI002B22EE0A|nr:hypothetical protein [Glaciimonas sp. Gout2]MEB0081727.1 hypothetical protein [Glaciimonas sp. Gout2]